MPSKSIKSTLKELLEQAPKKVQLEILMHIQMAEGQANSKLSLSKELQKMISDKKTKE